MDTEFIEYDDQRWRECLSKIDYEFYQLPEFANLESELIDGKPTAWYGMLDGNRVLIPLVKRLIPESITNGKEYYDLISPYGYPGLLYNSELTNYELTRLLKSFRNDAKNDLCISAFIRLNPFQNARLLDENEDINQVVHGNIVSINMKIEYEKRYMEYSSQKRRDIKKNKKEGLSIIWNDWDLLDNFIQIYNETMDRQEADSYYYFPRKYYEKLRKMMGDLTLDLVMAKNEQDVPVAGSIFVNNGTIMQYHLSGTATEYIRQAPVNLIFDEVFKKYCGSLKYFNLGGGVGNKRDSLFKFKERFGKEYRKFSTLRIVNDRQRYNNLCQHYSKKELYDLTGYFPLYRKE